VAVADGNNDLQLEYQRGRFHSRIVELTLDGKTIKTLPQDMQFHPVSDQIEHVDFLRVEDGMQLRVYVPVVFHGVEKSVGVKRGGVLNVVRREIEFTCTVSSIPTHIDVNISELDIGQSLHINDITLPEGVKPTIKRNFTVATVAGRGKSMEDPVETTAAATPAEGAAPAEGTAAAAGEKKDDAKKDEKK
ncbi:MAG: 50S ribosomal protein L25/general stress protein Ctc, partial [Alphaproteobacteria bacterium]